MSFGGVMMPAQLPPVTADMLVVFAITLLAFSLFATERVPVDVTALIVMVALMVLEPWTQISVEAGVAGFSNDATITVLAMFILSAGISRTGAVQQLGKRMASFAGSDERRQLLSVVSVAGIPSGFLNNTPIVAMLIPAVSDLAREGGTSPSKLLIPLSYASMVGGMLTLIGTSTNLVASDVSARLLGRPFSMFEFTGLGAIVFLTGAGYLLLVGHRLIPERIAPDEGLLAEYEMSEYLTEVVVAEDSPLVGRTITTIDEAFPPEIAVVQVLRGNEEIEGSSGATVEGGDALIVRAGVERIQRLAGTRGLSIAATDVTEATFGGPASGAAADVADGETERVATARDSRTFVELVIPTGSSFVGKRPVETSLGREYGVDLLSLRRGTELLHRRLEGLVLDRGDTLLVHAAPETLERMAADPNVIVARELADRGYRTDKLPLAVGIVLGVVGLAALGVLDILVAALGGVIAMVLGGVLDPDELYDAVEWDVIFLLAGLIPLGIAFDRTGTAALIGALVAETAAYLPALGVLWVFYVITALTTAVVSNAGSVVLMIPIGVATAGTIGANPFAFVLAVTFAASADFMTPVGYQTNLLVYGPGGYRFTDYARVGAPLQLVLSVVTVLGIAALWGV
ncbi:SLC13 family permease [Halococcus saccharolyticus]|uniref:Arsenite transport protein n=1 Tax=Halococcus saccharolyticus DSM 5350 TaxID=1227455 RepID=M0MDB3_9EURY|nr:SLC13 family permease [Halococcus saccharolyticus]EMA43762.1 arsenite transport protein [Halococcus saccharolyticus DSM 5350]